MPGARAPRGGFETHKILPFRVYAQVGFAYNRGPWVGAHTGFRARTVRRGTFQPAFRRPRWGLFRFCLFVLEEGGADGPLFCFRVSSAEGLRKCATP
jgi:hypothetical protein